MAEHLRSRNALLRWWRVTQSTLTLEAMARAAGVGVSTLHNWETGVTGSPGTTQLAALDDRLGAGGALRGIYAAIGTPDAFRPEVAWWFNYQGEPRPCWAWIRIPGDRPVNAEVDAGPFRAEFSVPPGDGVFLQAYAFATNPAVHVAIETGGWVAFGYGELPADLGAEILDAANFAIVGPRGSLDPALMAATHRYLPDKFGRKAWFETLRRRFGDRVLVAREALSHVLQKRLDDNVDVSAAVASRDEVARHWGGELYKHLRIARGLSLNDLAEEASRQDPSLPAITRTHVNRLEEGGMPRVPQLLERLDRALDADGRTCAVELDPDAMRVVGQGLVDLHFPSYWIGPVWLQFLRSSRAAGDRVELIWRPWRKSVTVRDGVVATTRRAEPGMAPLRVKLPSGWNLRAGVGSHPRAVDVNEGWGLLPHLTFETLSYYLGILERAMRRPRA
ncbi:helix-turn-helix transcriptional regulator [Actinoplanes sp. NPDC051343]|uniref:helix-turn-helix transcriptional regulator n=1 Tax=Actinoplanes sp. NPDC051343 TaxID=3363906 RepID=UPI0037A549A5